MEHHPAAAAPQGKPEDDLAVPSPAASEMAPERGAVSQAEPGIQDAGTHRAGGVQASDLEVVFEAVTEGVLVLDEQGGLRRMNAASRTLLALAAHPAYASSPLSARLPLLHLRDPSGQLIPEAQWPGHRLLRGESLQGAEVADLLMTSLDGRERHVTVSGAPLRDVTGHLMGAVLLARDVTERRRLEQQTSRALHTLLAMAEALVQGTEQVMSPVAEVGSSPHPVAQHLLTLTRSVLSCQRISLALLEPETGRLALVAVEGLSAEQQQQVRSELSSLSPDDTLAPAWVARLATGDVVSLDTLRSTTEASCSVAEQTVLLPMCIEGQLIGVLVLDYLEGMAASLEKEVSLATALARLAALAIERERLLRERAEAQANALALLEANRQMDSFLMIASHELRTPLTTMKLYLQLAQRRLHAAISQKITSPTEVGEALHLLRGQLRRSEEQVARLERLESDLLDVSRIQSGKLAVRPALENLAALVGEVVEEQRQATPGRPLQLQLDPGAQVPIFADADRIRQVLTNYLTNACKYSPAGQPIEVGVRVEGRQAQVWVHDHGPGIPPAEQGRVWERFYRAAEVEVQQGSQVGLGLGLYISRTIIEQHQGQVGLESSRGQGTTFWFTLPLPGS